MTNKDCAIIYAKGSYGLSYFKKGDLSDEEEYTVMTGTDYADSGKGLESKLRVKLYKGKVSFDQLKTEKPSPLFVVDVNWGCEAIS
jgi:hypothetical protein